MKLSQSATATQSDGYVSGVPRCSPRHATPNSAADRSSSRQEGNAALGEHVVLVPTWHEVAGSHSQFVYSMALRCTRNPHDAQDLTQEVFLRVGAGLGNYQPDNLEAWLNRITVNCFRDALRKKQRQRTHPYPAGFDRTVEGSPGIEAELAQHRLPEDLQDLLAGLPGVYRAPVVMKDVIGYSYEEIAAHLNAPIGTVRSRLYRGRARLRDALNVRDEIEAARNLTAGTGCMMAAN